MKKRELDTYWLNGPTNWSFVGDFLSETYIFQQTNVLFLNVVSSDL